MALITLDLMSNKLPDIRPRCHRSSQGRVPTLRGLALAAPRYLRPGFHPSQEGDLGQALDYIAISPAHAEHRRSGG